MSFMDLFKWFLHSHDHVPRLYFSYAFQRFSKLRVDKTEDVKSRRRRKRDKKKKRRSRAKIEKGIKKRIRD